MSNLQLPWDDIETVMLDMDGVLLDLHFDNHFWLNHVPTRYAEKIGCNSDEARQQLMQKMDAQRGKLEWYCLDYWSEELGLDVAGLKREIDHLIAVHPHVLPMLEALRKSGKTVWLVTNAHRDSLSLKMEKTRLDGWFDSIISTHDYRVPKEDQAFWQGLREDKGFAPGNSLMVDDTARILTSAQTFGIAHLLRVLKPDSKRDAAVPCEFPAVHDFSELLMP